MDFKAKQKKKVFAAGFICTRFFKFTKWLLLFCLVANLSIFYHLLCEFCYSFCPSELLCSVLSLFSRSSSPQLPDGGVVCLGPQSWLQDRATEKKAIQDRCDYVDSVFTAAKQVHLITLMSLSDLSLPAQLVLLTYLQTNKYNKQATCMCKSVKFCTNFKIVFLINKC